jgi:hypothetical protein
LTFVITFPYVSIGKFCKSSVIPVQDRFADRKLVSAINLEVGMEGAGGSTSMEIADNMIESLSLETKDQDQPSSSKVTMKTFQSNNLKNRHVRGRKKGIIKKNK